MHKNKVDILIADDHSIVAGGYKLLLSMDQKFNVLDILSNGRQVMAYLESNTCDVLILDLNMPNGDGLEVVEYIKNRGLDIKILVVSMLASPILMQSVMEKGIDGYLYKTSKPDALLKALDAILNGKTYFETKDSKRAASQHTYSFQIDGRETSISFRELEIIKLISRGKSTKAIADELFISEHTVLTHRKNINQKLNVHNTAELVSAALKYAIISPL